MKGRVHTMASSFVHWQNARQKFELASLTPTFHIFSMMALSFPTLILNAGDDPFLDASATWNMKASRRCTQSSHKPP